MRYLRLAGMVLVLVGAGLVAYNAPMLLVGISWRWEGARQGFASGVVLILGGVFLARWK